MGPWPEGPGIFTAVGVDGWSTIGLFGLIASFHGIILAAARATMELGRARFLPGVLGVVNVRTGTPIFLLALSDGPRCGPSSAVAEA